jgi:hypothetical protein
LDKVNVRLRLEYARLSPSELLEHFRSRSTPSFLPGFNASNIETTVRLQRATFPAETEGLLARAERMVTQHRWQLMGYGERDFGEKIEWLRDPLSGVDWEPVYHGDVEIARRDGSDVRVLWELNRLTHFLTLGRAYALTNDERFALEFFAQLESWQEQNPTALGANWMCAMEVALRAINLLAAFELFRRSPHLSEERLKGLLALFDHHGEHIRRNLEFSYIWTSNHYLSDVVGLLWLGVMLPELRAARSWREFGLREMLREMDKQILADGADCEASTGYHRFVLELFLYSFMLCRANGIEIEDRYWRRLRAMLDYMRAYLRPCGRAPLIGDSDGGQVLPLVNHSSDDHAYVLTLGASALKDSRFKVPAGSVPEELLWFSGERAVREYESLAPSVEAISSQAFEDAGTYVMRDRDLYLLFNASDSGLGGRGSHGHNDALGLEVSACGSLFIVDPGTYAYRADYHGRHLFRSTAYHSTVEVDGAEQNTIDEEWLFFIGNEARPRALRWETGPERDLVLAEHYGYQRLREPVLHRRAVEFDKRERCWIIEDALIGDGEHVFSFRFHIADRIEVSIRADALVQACDRMSGARLLISALGSTGEPSLEPRSVSRDYGARSASVSVCWTVHRKAPLVARWAIVPVCPDEDETARLELISRLKDRASVEA